MRLGARGVGDFLVVECAKTITSGLCSHVTRRTIPDSQGLHGGDGTDFWACPFLLGLFLVSFACLVLSTLDLVSVACLSCLTSVILRQPEQRANNTVTLQISRNTIPLERNSHCRCQFRLQRREHAAICSPDIFLINDILIAFPADVTTL